MATQGHLNNNENSDFTDFFRLSYKDLKRSGFLATLVAANQVIIGYVQPGGAVSVCSVCEITQSAGAADIVFDVGVTGADPDDFIDALDADGMTKVVYNTGDALTVSGDDGTLYVNNTASAVPIYLEVGGTVASLTAGEWVICWKAFDPNRFGVNPVV
jgi:hypothetical protein